MSDFIAMEYRGFKSTGLSRKYSFRVRYAADDVRAFTLTIRNEAFTSHKVRYQDAPDLCSLKLRRELIANADYPSDTNFPVTDSELDAYTAEHAKRPSNRLHRPRPKDGY